MTQAQAFSIMKTGVNIYLTGSAGSGKTYLLNQYIEYCKNHDITVACTASTGIASTHMNGMTIHGWSGIGIKETLTEHDIDALEQKSYLWKRFDKTKVLIIDEVSMLHAHRLDMVNTICKRFKRNDKPFGGLQVILSGDFFQLPPINKNNQLNNKDMITHSSAWKEMNPAICYLTDQYRQEDSTLTNILNNIRDNKITDKDIKLLEDRIGATLQQDIQPTKLYTHNVHVDSENVQELEKITDQQEVYKMETTGHEALVDILKKSCLAQEQLILKIGAEVMYIKNNFEQNYVNGTRGKVIGFTEGFESRDKMPIVKLYNGKTIYTNYETWEIEENGKVKASLKALPLRLAWAITIHKSQGMSLDHAQIDLSNTFSYGMGYVALSRVRTLSGITLVGFNPNALNVDSEVLKLDESLRNQSEENTKLFGALKKSAQEKLEHDFILKMDGVIYTDKKKKITKEKPISTIEETKILLEKGKTIKQISKERNLTQGTITHHIEQIIENNPNISIEHIKPKKQLIEIVQKAYNRLEGEEVGRLSPIKKLLEEQGIEATFEDIRLACLFIKK